MVLTPPQGCDRDGGKTLPPAPMWPQVHQIRCCPDNSLESLRTDALGACSFSTQHVMPFQGQGKR